MSLSDRLLPRPPAPDEAIGRYLAAIRPGLDPDPLFRRRLRGHLVNRFVAAREDQQRDAARTSAREMGRLGRAVLHATFALGLSVTGVMAASQQAIPGDPFYVLKLEIEAMRERVLPQRLQADLAAYNLGRRIDELNRLAEAGRWELVAGHAAAVERAYAAVVETSPGGRVHARHLAVITTLLEGLPLEARIFIDDLIDGVPGIGGGAPRGNGAAPPGAGRGEASNGVHATDGLPGAAGGSGQGSSGTPPARTPSSRESNAVTPTRGGPNSTDAAAEHGDDDGAADELSADVETDEPTATPTPTPAATPAPTPTATPKPAKSSRSTHSSTSEATPEPTSDD